MVDEHAKNPKLLQSLWQGVVLLLALDRRRLWTVALRGGNWAREWSSGSVWPPSVISMCLLFGGRLGDK